KHMASCTFPSTDGSDYSRPLRRPSSESLCRSGHKTSARDSHWIAPASHLPDAHRRREFVSILPGRKVVLASLVARVGLAGLPAVLLLLEFGSAAARTRRRPLKR